MAYTQDEIQAAVEKLVLSTIRRPYDTLGVRRTDLSFSDIQQAAAQVLVLYQNAAYYLLFLGAHRLFDGISSEAALLDQVLAAVNAVGRRVLPVGDVSPLFNAQAALQELSGASRQATFQDVTTLPAYQRLSTNVSSFLSGPGQAVKSGGDIVETPQAARAALPGLMTQLQAAHQSLVAQVGSISAGGADYTQLNLPSIVAQSVLSNSASLLGADAAALNSLSPEARLTLVRQTVLDVLTVKSAVDTFGSFSPASEFYSLQGTGSTFSDGQHLATPALAQADHGGGYAIISTVTDDLNVTDSGGSPFDIILAPSILAELDGTADDSGFFIGDGTSPAVGQGQTVPNNNEIKVKVGASSFTATLTVSGAPTPASLTGTGDTSTAGWYGGGGTLDGKNLVLSVRGVATYTVPLVAPANVTALLNQINAVILVVGPNSAFATNVGNRLVLTTSDVGPGASIEIVAGSALTTLGFSAGESAHGANGTRTADQVAADIQLVLPAGIVAEGYYSPLIFSGLMDIPVGSNTTWTLTGGPVSDLVALGVKATGYTVQVQSGANAGFYPITGVTSTSVTVAGATVAQPGASVQIGPQARKVRIRANNPAVQLPLELSIMVYGDDQKSSNGCNTLGFYNGASSACSLTTPDLVAKDINAKTSKITAGTAIVNQFTNRECRSDILNANQVTFANGSLVGSQSFLGTTLTFTVSSSPSSSPLYVPYVPFISIGDTIVLRDGPNPGAYYTVTEVNGDSIGGPFPAAGAVITATGSVSGSSASNVNAEVGGGVSASRYQVVTLGADPQGASSLPGPNGGTYFLAGQAGTPLDVLTILALPMPRSGAGPVTMGGSFGSMYLTLASQNTTAQSELVLQGTAAPTFFSSSPKTQLGSSPWFQLPSIPRGLQGGDILEFYESQYNSPSSSFIIDSVIAGLNIIQVSPDVPDASSLTFSVTPVPFARLRYGVLNDFSSVKALLDAWLANSVNQPSYFQSLSRLINPLVANTTPTASQVGSALAGINALYAFLTATQAAFLNQPTSQALDSIVQTFTVAPVPAVDALIKSYTDKGSDRATDLLLSGQFSTFFGLTAEEASYAGAFQAATRSVAMNDLPVSRYNRQDAQGSQLVAQAASPDYEFTGASLNENLGGAQVAPPQLSGTPSNFGTTTGSSGAGG